MAKSTTPQATIDQITQTKGVLQSATLAMNGWKSKLEAALEASLHLGATAAELAPVQTAVDELALTTAETAAAIAANP